MNVSTETIISTVSCSADRRVVIALGASDASLPIVLRTESFSSDVGWFTQQSIQLSRSELQCLRNLLGIRVHRACEATLNAIESQEHEEISVIPFVAARQRTA